MQHPTAAGNPGLLVACEACGGRLSRYAPSCQACGHPQKNVQRRNLLLVAVFVVVTVGGLGALRYWSIHSMERAQADSLRPLVDLYRAAEDPWQRCSLASTLGQLADGPEPGTDWRAMAIRDCADAGEPAPRWLN